MSPKGLWHMEEALRSLLIGLSTSGTMNRWAKKYGLRFGARRFVAGDTIEDAISVVRELAGRGIATTLDHLGEFVSDEEEARASAQVCVETIRGIRAAEADSTLSVKLTQLGLDIRRDLCLENMKMILEAAKEHRVGVNIDMEDYARCQVTLDMYRELRKDYPFLQTVIQAYLYRSGDDVASLAHEGAGIRIVKGAYKEDESVAYPLKSDVDANYVKLLETHLLSEGLTSIATHDERIIEHAKAFIKRHNIPSHAYEFQMLYGIRLDLQQEMVAQGYPLRIYVPYGDDWYGYFMRRLAERPANVAFVLRGVVSA